MTNDEKRIALIRELQNVCQQYDAIAIEDAKAAVRNPSDEKAMANAQRTQAKADVLDEAFHKIVTLVNKHWPS